MKIVTRDPVCFYSRPTSSWISAAKKSPRRRYKVKILADGIVRDFMDVQVVNSLTHVFPGFAAIEASDDPPMFNRKIERIFLFPFSTRCIRDL
jgi:hypothetical protein